MSEKTKQIRNIILYLIPGIFLLLGAKLGLIYYVQTDDFEMNNISWGGSSGVPNEHIVFIKSILGRLFKELYEINSKHNWFGLYYLFIVLAITYAFLMVFKRHTSISIAVIIAFICEIIIVSWLTFTTLAYLCSLVGVLILSEIEKEMSLKAYILMGVATTFFFVSSFAIRDDSFKSGCLLLLPLIWFALKKQNIKVLTCIVICIVLGIGLVNVYEKKSYGSKLWQDYLRFNSARSANVDFPIDKYDDNEELYKSVNLSENDVICLKGWLLGDKVVFSEDVLNKIAKDCTKGTRYNYTPVGILKQLISLPIAIIYLIILTPLAVLFIVWSDKNRYIQILQFLFTAGSIGVLFVINRPLERVIVPLAFMGIISILYMFIKENTGNSIYNLKRVMVVSVMVTFLVMISYMTGSFSINKARGFANKYDEEREYIWNNRDKCFVVESMETISQFNPVTKINDNDSYENTLDVGHWEIYNDVYYEKVEKFNLKYRDRLYIDFVENDNVYFLFSYCKKNRIVKRITNFIEEHTGRKIKTNVIKQFDKSGDVLYKFEYDD